MRKTSGLSELHDLTDALSQQSRLDQVVAIRRGIGARPAAVLILIRRWPAGPEIMFVERAADMRTHPGQIAFPAVPLTRVIMILPTPRSVRLRRRPASTAAGSTCSVCCHRPTLR